MLLKAPRVTMARGRSCRQLGIWSRRYPLVCRADALMKKQRLLAKAKAEMEAEAGNNFCWRSANEPTFDWSIAIGRREPPGPALIRTYVRTYVCTYEPYVLVVGCCHRLRDNSVGRPDDRRQRAA